jgi:hypothetical protein
MEMCMRVTGSMENKKVKDLTIVMVENIMKENGKMVSMKEKV